MPELDKFKSFSADLSARQINPVIMRACRRNFHANHSTTVMFSNSENLHGVRNYVVIYVTARIVKMRGLSATVAQKLRAWLLSRLNFIRVARNAHLTLAKFRTRHVGI